MGRLSLLSSTLGLVSPATRPRHEVWTVPAMPRVLLGVSVVALVLAVVPELLSDELALPLLPAAEPLLLVELVLVSGWEV